MTPIVLCVDERYVGPAAVTLSSLASSATGAGSSFDVIVLACGLDAKDGARLRQLAEWMGLSLEIRAVAVPSDVVVSGCFTPAAYGRLLIPDALFDHSSALYLDSDVLVLDSLDPLLRTPLDGRPLGAVRDTRNPFVECGICLQGWRSLGLPGMREYFNSGVMLLDLEAWRTQDLGHRALAFQRDFPQHVECMDQDALNVVVDDQWKRLELQWNTFPMSDFISVPGRRYLAEEFVPLEHLIAAEDTAAVLHFAGPWKPWHADYPRGHWWARYSAALQELSQCGYLERTEA